MTAEPMDDVEVADDEDYKEAEDDLVELEAAAQEGEEDEGIEAAATTDTPTATAISEATEREKDDPPGGKAAGQHVTDEVTLNTVDATLDTFFDMDRGILSSLSSGGFQHLLSGARANTGATNRRYLFEVQTLVPPAAKNVLRVGFSTAGSSLFLGDASGDGFGFDSEGMFHAEGQKKKTHERMGRKVIGVLLNLDKDGDNANTVSLFLDGVRAGNPQAIPAKLLGKALFPTITFMNVTLAVNFGKMSRQLRPLPFRCTMFGDILKADCEQSAFKRSPDGSFQVVVPVGLPEQGIFDFVDFFRSKQPQFEELSDRRLLQWCRESGLQQQKAPSATSSRDHPDFSLSVPLDGKSMRPMLQTLAMLARRDLIICEVGASLLQTGRANLVATLPSSARTCAVVAIGQSSASFQEWSKHKTKVDGVSDVPDVSEKAISCYAKFCLPSEAEGFSKVDFEWLGREAAEAHLKAWILERKGTSIINDLEPGAWFKGRLQEWHALRPELQKRHVAYNKQRKENPELDAGSSFDIKNMTIEDIHDVDSKGSPIYGNFKFEDWLILTWRYELHLLAHTFAADVADPDRPGIPEELLPHYYNIYYKTKCDPQKLGCENLQKVFKVLKLTALELATKGGKSKLLSSGLDKDTPLKDFIIGVEIYRRDRNRRIDAGDESAQLVFPRGAPPAKAGAKAAAPASAKPNGSLATVAKATTIRPAVKAVSKAPVVAVSPAAAAAAGASAVKRPMPPGMPPPGFKRPRVDGDRPAAPPVSARSGVLTPGKAPVAKTPVAKVAVAKAPVAKSFVSKA